MRRQIRDIVQAANAHYAGNGWGRQGAGVDTKIVWRLATEDEDGEPTTGVMLYDNADWYFAGDYFSNSWTAFVQGAGWDPDRHARAAALHSTALHCPTACRPTISCISCTAIVHRH